MAKTQREYYNYSSHEPVKAEILEVRRHSNTNTAIILDKTIFYPEGGGQPSDRGTINGQPILDVTEEDGEILHIMADNALFNKTGSAELVLDHRRRRFFSVIHTGQHLLSGVLFKTFGIATKSVHMGEDICFIDIDCSGYNGKARNMPQDRTFDINSITEETEDLITDIIEENRKVIVHLCPPEDISSFPLRKQPPKGEEVIRVLEIEGLDFSPCCGTHLDSTGQIMTLRILGGEKYKGMIRLGFITGRRCLYDSRLNRKNAEIISRALSVPIAETGKGVLDYMEKTMTLEQQIRAFREEDARLKTKALIKNPGVQKNIAGKSETVIVQSYQLDMNEILNIGKKAQKSSSAILVLISETENKFAAFCGQKEIDIRPLFKDSLEKHNGKGGGGPSFFQGSFGTKKDLAEFAKEVV